MPTCKHRRIEIDCPFCFTSVAWAIVKDAKGMRDSGHDSTVRWARAALGLEDRKEVVAVRATHDEERYE